MTQDKILKQLKELKFSNLKINEKNIIHVNNLLRMILENATVFHKFSALVLNQVQGNVILELPKVCRFKTFIIKNLDGATLHLPTSLTCIKMFEIENFNLRSKLNLLTSLENLMIFKIGFLKSNLVLDLQLMPNLKNFTIARIDYKVRLSLLLDLQPLLEQDVMNFKAEHLESIKIENIGSGAIVDFPEILDHLLNMTLGGICCGAKILFPTSLANLKNLTIELNANASVTLARSFNNITTLTINAIGCKARFILPESLPNLINLRIGILEEGSKLYLPSSLDKLVTFTIGTIYSGAILTPLNSFKSLRNFTWDLIEDEETRELFESIKAKI